MTLYETVLLAKHLKHVKYRSKYLFVFRFTAAAAADNYVRAKQRNGIVILFIRFTIYSAIEIANEFDILKKKPTPSVFSCP